MIGTILYTALCIVGSIAGLGLIVFLGLFAFDFFSDSNIRKIMAEKKHPDWCGCDGLRPPPSAQTPA